MKGNLKSCLVIFLVAMLVMQVVFNDSWKAGAAHSAAGSISTVNGIRVVVEEGTNKVSPCYCIERTKWCSTNDKVTSNLQIDATKSFLLNAAFLYGFNVNTTAGSITAADYAAWNKTQESIWAIMEGTFDGTVNTIANCKTSDAEVLKKIAYLNAEPSYVTKDVQTLSWVEEKGKYVLELTNTIIEGSYSANSQLQVDTTSLPEGVTAVVEGEKITLESTTEFTDAKTIKIFKRPADKGLVVAWDNGNGTKQPQITLDYDEAPVAKVMEMTIKTNVKETKEEQQPEQTPTQPQPEQTPVEPQPEQIPDVPQLDTPPMCPDDTEEPIVEQVEVKDNNFEEVKVEELKDDTPDTGDSTNLTLVYKLLAASAVAMVWLGTVTVVKKRRNRI